MKISRLVSGTLALAVLTGLSAGAANAQAINAQFISVAPSAGQFTYTYQLFLLADTKTVTGNLVTFYDFDGLLNSGVNVPAFVGSSGASYSISVQNTGLNPPGTVALAGDNNGLPNVSLTYNGVSPLVNTGPGSVGLGTLTLHSSNGVNVGGDFTPFAANHIKNSNGSPSGNQAFVTGPNAALPTPEPGTLAMFVGMGISGMAFARRRNRRK